MSEDVNEEEEPKLVTSTLEDFEEAVKIARVLIDRGDINVKPSLPVILTVDESVLEHVLESSSMDVKTFSKILRLEIANMITALLLEIQDRYTSFVLRDVEDGETEGQKALVEQKFRIVDNIIIDRAIRDRFLVRATSKVDSLEDIYWEISEKKHTNDRELVSLRYATIRLEFARNPEFGKINTPSPVGPFLILEPNQEPLSVVFDCDVSQIDELIDVLSDIRKKLEGQEKK